jgi:hypothetical protein
VVSATELHGICRHKPQSLHIRLGLAKFRLNWVVYEGEKLNCKKDRGTSILRKDLSIDEESSKQPLTRDYRGIQRLAVTEALEYDISIPSFRSPAGESRSY